jgi:hypothetical protein
MTMDYDRYPSNWKSEIVPSMHARAGSQCEWIEWEAGEWVRCPKMHRDARQLHDETSESTKPVTLTTGHIGAPTHGTHGNPHDKMDVRDENLLLMCGSHHLRYDLQDHMRHARETRAARKLSRQKELYSATLF